MFEYFRSYPSNLAMALALQAGIHPNVVGRIERGIYNPSVMILYAIAVKLNTSVLELFAGADKRQ